MSTEIEFEATSRGAQILDRDSGPTSHDEFSTVDPSPSNPVTASMAIRPEEAQPGDIVELLVHVRIARAHYVHAGVSQKSFTPLEMNLDLPDGLEADGDWQFPTPETAGGNDFIFRNSVALRRLLKILPNATSNAMTVTGELRYQACNDELCWPPGKMDLTTSLTIKRR